MKAANEHGGNDNITVVVIDVVLGETDGSDALLGPAGAAAASAGPGQGPSPATTGAEFARAASARSPRRVHRPSQRRRLAPRTGAARARSQTP